MHAEYIHLNSWEQKYVGEGCMLVDQLHHLLVEFREQVVLDCMHIRK